MFPRPLALRHLPSRLALFVVIAALAALAAGCGGDKEPAPDANQSSRSMVPAGLDTAAVDSLTAAMPADVDAASRGTDDGEVRAAIKSSDTAPAAAGPSGAAQARGQTAPARVTDTGGGYTVQLGSFARETNAEALAARVKELGYRPVVEVATLGGQTYHRVVLGGLSDRNEAERLGEHIRSELGITYLVRQK